MTDRTGNRLLAEAERWMNGGPPAEPDGGGAPEDAVRNAVAAALGPWAVTLTGGLRMDEYADGNAGFCMFCLRNDVPAADLRSSGLWTAEERKRDVLPGTDWIGPDGRIGFVTTLQTAEQGLTAKICIGGRREAFEDVRMGCCRMCRPGGRGGGRRGHRSHNRLTFRGLEPGEGTADRGVGTLDAVPEPRWDGRDRPVAMYGLNVLAVMALLSTAEEDGHRSVSTRDLGAWLRARRMAAVVRSGGGGGRGLLEPSWDEGRRGRFAERILPWIAQARAEEGRLTNLTDVADALRDRAARRAGEREAEARKYDAETADAETADAGAADPNEAAGNGETGRGATAAPRGTEERADEIRSDHELLLRMVRQTAGSGRARQRTLGMGRSEYLLEWKQGEGLPGERGAEKNLSKALAATVKGIAELSAEIGPVRRVRPGETNGGTDAGNRWVARFEPWRDAGEMEKVLTALRKSGAAEAHVSGTSTSGRRIGADEPFRARVRWSGAQPDAETVEALKEMIAAAAGRPALITDGSDDVEEEIEREERLQTEVRIFRTAEADASAQEERG